MNAKVGKNFFLFQSIFTNYIVKLISDFSFFRFSSFKYIRIAIQPTSKEVVDLANDLIVGLILLVHDFICDVINVIKMKNVTHWNLKQRRGRLARFRNAEAERILGPLKQGSLD